MALYGSLATIVASRVIVSKGTALRGIVLVLIENMWMFALEWKKKSKLETSQVSSIWLEISKVQGPKKKMNPFYKREDQPLSRTHRL